VTVTVVPATLDRFDDVVAVLPTGGGEGGFGCTCQYFRMSSGDYNRSTGAGRLEALRSQLAATPAPGVLAYSDGDPVGWCGFAPRSDYERLVRSRTIPVVDDIPVWSVVCFVVRAGHRRRGVTAALLAGAIDYARANGCPALEAYPIDPGDDRVSTAFLYVGRVSTFEAAGFRKVVKTDATSARLPRWLMRLDLS
jgi:GNAT superfamily N-acetyltransferase